MPSKVFHEGQAYFTVAGAAENLGTNAVKVRKLMGAGEVEYLNLRANGRLLIPAISLQAYKDRTRATKL